MDSDVSALKPLANADGEPIFDEPWQAQVLAVADSLVQNGMFSAGSWSEALGQVLRDAEARGAADNQETYYTCVLSAVENLVTKHSVIDREAIADKRKDWEKAYLSTPHGQPVRFG